MNVVEHYLSLRFSYKQIGDFESGKTTTHEIASVLCCTMRNVHLILKKLTEENWIEWKTQRGRGKRSTLTFIWPLKEAALTHFITLLQQNKIEQAISFSKHPNLTSEIQIAMADKLHHQFGFQKSSESNGEKDVLVIPHAYEVSTLDPGEASIVNEAHFINQIFDSLVRYNIQTQEIEPHLVNGWDERHKGRTWTFYLRKGIVFHHGKELTTQDVYFTFQRLMTMESPMSYFLEQIIDIRIKDSYTITFFLKESNYLFLHFLSSLYASILPADVNEKELVLIGTGPFCVKTFHKDMLILEAFDTYFKERAYLDRIEIWFTPLGSIQRSNYQIQDGKQSKTKRVEREDVGSNFMTFNLKKEGPHHNLNFRKAINAIVDQQRMINELKGSRMAPAGSFLPEKSHGMAFMVSQEKAMRYLSQTHYKHERLTIGVFDFPEYTDDVKWIVRRANEIGIMLDIELIQLSDLYKQTFLETCDMVYAGETFEDNIDLSYFIFFKSQSSILRMLLNQQQLVVIDQLLEKAVKEKTYKTRMGYYHKIEEYLRASSLIIYTGHTLNVEYYDEAICGIEVNGYGYPDYRKLWIKTEA